MLTAITSSADLAQLLNTCPPATAADAAETPLDWPAMALPGADGLTVYNVDRGLSTATRCVLADGLADVELVGRTWRPADYDEWTDPTTDAVVSRDVRTVYVGQASFADTTVCDSVDEARALYATEVAQMIEICAQMRADTDARDEDDQ